MIGVTLKAAHRTATSVTIKWKDTIDTAALLMIETEGGRALPEDLTLDPGELLDALTVLAAQRVDRDAQHATHAYSEYPGPGTSLGVFRDQLVGKMDRSDAGDD